MVFIFEGFSNILSKCEVDILGNVAVVTQMDMSERPGTSVTNAAETIAEDICNKFKIPYKKLIFIEHYKDESFGQETYSLVNFDIDCNKFLNPKWKRISLETVAEIINTKSGYEDIEKFVVDNKKSLELTYKTRNAFLQAICPHSHYIKSFDDNKDHCYACDILKEEAPESK